MKLPGVSICTCTYNGEEVMENYLEGIFSQDYPLEKIEILFNDGGSTDKTKEIIAKYMKKFPGIIKLFHNEKQYSIGRDFGMDNVTQKAKGEIVVQLDQDNILVQKDWLSESVKILIENPEIVAVQSGLLVPEDGTIIDKYLNATGIEDPFAFDYSLNAQIVLYPWKFKYNKEGDFFVYKINKKNFYYAGDNGFLIRKKEFIETGGYTQDIDNFYRMALSGKKYLIALPRKIKLHHQTSTELKHYLYKKFFNIAHYLTKNYEGRDFYWFDLKKFGLGHNFKFVKTVLSNLLFVPGLFQGMGMALKQRRAFWLIHPFLLFSITWAYIYSFFYSRLFVN